jgi:hypothetical protein
VVAKVKHGNLILEVRSGHNCSKDDSLVYETKVSAKKHVLRGNPALDRQMRNI